MTEKFNRNVHVTSKGKKIKEKIDETKTNWTVHIQSCDGGTRLWGNLYFERDPQLNNQDELSIQFTKHQKTLVEDEAWGKKKKEEDESEDE